MVVMDAASDNVGMCVCSMDVYRDGHRHRLRYRDEELSPREATARLVAGTGMGTPCWLVRRTAMEAAGGFNNALPRMQDYDCALRLARRFSIHLMSDPLVIAEIGKDSLSASASRYARAIEIILKDHHDPFFIDPTGHSRMVFRAGKYYAIEGRTREARRWFRRALRINPLNLRAVGGLVLSVTGLFPLFSRIKYHG
jgi:tetratricopeptide (TPR) repeat protein